MTDKIITYQPPTERSQAVVLAHALGMMSIHRHVKKDEVDLARKAAKDDTTRLLIDLLWVTGARISEALSVKVENVDFRGRHVAMPTLKRPGGVVMYRGIPLQADFLGELAVYLNNHHRTSQDRIIPWRRTKAWEVISSVLLEVGVPRDRAFPHAFRHGHALFALSNGVPINVIQRTLGHSTILTTQTYVQATGQDIAHSYDRIRWTD
jgi:integrase/recombinase XerD